MKNLFLALALFASAPCSASVDYNCGNRFALSFSTAFLSGRPQVRVRSLVRDDGVNAYTSIDTTLFPAGADEAIDPQFEVYEDARPDLVSRRPNPWILHVDRASPVGGERITGTLLSAIRGLGAGVQLDCVRN